jgi:hypothetical protein
MTEYNPHAKVKLIRIGMSTSDLAAGAAATHRAIETYLGERDHRRAGQKDRLIGRLPP